MSACRECPKCGRRLSIIDGYAICPRCHFDLTGEESERADHEARDGLRGSDSPREGAEA